MTISFNANSGPMVTNVNSDCSSSEASALQIAMSPQEEASCSTISTEVSCPATNNEQTTDFQKGLSKIEALKKAFINAASIGSDAVGTFDEWILHKTKRFEHPYIYLINILAHDIFRHFILVENNIQKQNISKREFNRHYKPAYNRLKGLFSLMFFFNKDIQGHNENLKHMNKNCDSLKDLNTIVYSQNIVLSLKQSLKLLENEIFRTLLGDQKIKKTMDTQSIQELIFTFKFLKSVRENDSWVNLKVRANTIASYLKNQGVTLKALTENELIQRSFTFLESLTNYINACSDRFKKAKRLVGNPSLPKVGSDNSFNKKIFSLNLEKQCRSIQRTLHQLNSQISKQSFIETFAVYQKLITEVNEVRSSMVSLITFEPVLVHYYPLEGPFDYNVFVRNIKGWPFSSLPSTDMLRKTFELQHDEEAIILTFLLNEVLIKKACTERIKFDLSKCNEIGLKFKTLYETSLKKQFEEIKSSSTDLPISKLCVSITSRVWEGVANNYYQLNEAINFFAANELKNISSDQEYNDFVNQALSLINSAYRHCDSIISTLFMNLSKDYKEAKKKGTDTAPIVEKLDELVDMYEQIVDFAEAFQSILENGDAPNIALDSSSSTDSTNTSEKTDETKETVITEVFDTQIAQDHDHPPTLPLEPTPSASSSSSTVQEKKASKSPKKGEAKVTQSTKHSARKKATTKNAGPKPALASWKETINETIETKKWDRHIKLRKLLRMMKKDGWKFLDKGRGKGSHIIADAPDGRRVTIPTSGGNGRALKPGTFKSISGQRKRTGRK